MIWTVCPRALSKYDLINHMYTYLLNNIHFRIAQQIDRSPEPLGHGDEEKCGLDDS